MKRLALVVLLIAGFASSAMAGQIQVGYLGSSFGPYQTGSGGEFTYNPINPTGWLSNAEYAATTKGFGADSTFQTFCVEIAESLSGYPTTYDAALSTEAKPQNDPISVGTGYLYSQFALGTLTGYNYGANRTVSAGLLQNAFWWLEDVPAITYDASNPFMKMVFDAFLGEAGAMADDIGSSYNVYAVNMWTLRTGGAAQDGLWYGTRVPDGGATLMLLGGALMGLGALRRKFRG